MDPNPQNHPISKPFAATRRRHHHREHPTCPPSSTIENISDRFSKLYTNHKKLVANSPQVETSAAPHYLDPHPQPDPHFQAKPISERHSSFKEDLAVVKFAEKEAYFSTRTHVKDKDEINKPSSKKSSFDVIKAPQLMMPEHLEFEKVKKFQQEFKVSVQSSNPPKGDNGRVKKSFHIPQGVKVVAVDMPPLMQIHAVECARKAHDSMEKFNSRALALTLKKEFDGAYGGVWHCIVGSSFGSFVTHSVGGFMYFSMDNKLYILLFKTTVQTPQSN